MRSIAILAAIVAAGAVIGFTGFTGENQADEGQKIYMERCASCHAQDGSGANARGRALKVPDLRSDAVQNKSDAQLVEAIMTTKGHPASMVKQLGEDGARKTVAFMRTLK
jgi:mono/diheme cytochrome c family protein